MPNSLLFLSKKDPTYGRHSSYYTQIPLIALPKRRSIQVFSKDRGLCQKIIGKACNSVLGIKHQSSDITFAQAIFLVRSHLPDVTLSHILNLEDHLILLQKNFCSNRRILATAHFPPNHWHESDLMNLEKLSGLITLCRRDQLFFGKYLSPNKIHFIRHGVQTNFFEPSLSNKDKTPRIIFVGKWLRDFEIAGDVIAAALQQWQHLNVDIVCSPRWFSGTSLEHLVPHPRVAHHSNVDDAMLKCLYQRAWFLFLPLHDTSANNALCEALSSGVIPIVNNVGGVEDYGGASLFPVVNKSCVKGYLDILSYYMSNLEMMSARSVEMRRFALQNLDWNLIRSQHISVYASLF